MRIGIDFDRVLFDTDSFNEYYKKETGLYHVDANVSDKNNNYDPEKHAKACDVPLTKIWSALEDLERFLYDDIELLEQINDHELVIVSRGNKEFQREKISSSNVEKIIDEVHVVEKGRKDKIEIDLLADDREKELSKVNTPGVEINRPEDSIKKLIRKVNRLES